MALNLNNFENKIIYQVIITNDKEENDIYPSSITPKDLKTTELMMLLTYLRNEIISIEDHLFNNQDEEDE